MDQVFWDLAIRLRADDGDDEYLFDPEWSDYLGLNHEGHEFQRVQIARWTGMRERGISDYGRRRPQFERPRADH